MLIFRGVSTFISTKNQHETVMRMAKVEGSYGYHTNLPTIPKDTTLTHHTDTPPMRISSIGSNPLGGSIRCPRSAVGLSCLNGTKRWYWMVITSMTFKMLLKKVLHFTSLFYVEYDLTIFEGQTKSQPTMAKMTLGNPGFDSQFLGSTHPNFQKILWGHLGVSFIPLTKNPRETNRWPGLYGWQWDVACHGCSYPWRCRLLWTGNVGFPGWRVVE